MPARDVSLAGDAYRLVINLDNTHLQLFKRGQLLADFPIDVGLPAYPTPTGHYFVALFAQAPSPGSGPFVIVTSAHSNAISVWEETGDAIDAITAIPLWVPIPRSARPEPESRTAVFAYMTQV